MKVYIGGDTAYDSTLFKETGRKYPGIDLAILPIAPINPREYSKSRHIDPAEALQITEDLGATFMLPMHYDTFLESLDTLGEARATLRDEISKRQFDAGRVAILDIGELRILLKKNGEVPLVKARHRSDD